MTEDGIFHPVVGHDGAKAVMRSALRNGDVNIMLVGPPASGKSVMLLAIEEHLSGASYHDAAGYTDSELRDAIADNPLVLLLDEFDAMRRESYDALALPMEHGRVTKDNKHESYDIEVDTQFVAACNHLDTIPRHIVDRFRTVEFEEYDSDEYEEVCARLLPEAVGWVQQAETARDIASIVYETIGSRSPRDARDAAKLAGTLADVEPMAEAMVDADADVESEPLTVEELQTRQNARDSSVSTFSGEMPGVDEWNYQSCPHLSYPENKMAYKSGRFRCPDCANGDATKPYN